MLQGKKLNRSSPPAGVTPLKEFLNREHPVYGLAAVLNWQGFEEEFGKLYAEGLGRPALPTRLLVGQHYLKYLYNVSDAVVIAS